MFQGADTDGLTKVGEQCEQGAQVADEAIQFLTALVIVLKAASWFSGGTSLAYAEYLETTVIPWLKRISQALHLFAKVLMAHAKAQNDASSGATVDFGALPTYTTPALPSTDCRNFPVIDPGSGSAGVSVGTSAGGAGTGTISGAAGTAGAAGAMIGSAGGTAHTPVAGSGGSGTYQGSAGSVGGVGSTGAGSSLGSAGSGTYSGGSGIAAGTSGGAAGGSPATGGSGTFGSAGSGSVDGSAAGAATAGTGAAGVPSSSTYSADQAVGGTAPAQTHGVLNGVTNNGAALGAAGAAAALGTGGAAALAGRGSGRQGSGFTSPDGFDYNRVKGVRGNARVTPEFLRKVEGIATRLGTKPEYLMAVMSAETVGTFRADIRNPLPGQTASGLIQFTEETAKHLHTTTAQLRAMTPVAQLDYVEKYLAEPQFRGKLGTVEGVYTSIFNGRALSNPDQVIYTQGAHHGPSTRDPYLNNKQYDTDGNGEISVRELAAQLTNRIAPAKK